MKEQNRAIVAELTQNDRIKRIAKETFLQSYTYCINFMTIITITAISISYRMELI